MFLVPIRRKVDRLTNRELVGRHRIASNAPDAAQKGRRRAL